VGKSLDHPAINMRPKRINVRDAGRGANIKIL
jgi:hypothetical protein